MTKTAPPQKIPPLEAAVWGIIEYVVNGEHFGGQ
jgi:hypothetical protein